MLHSSAGFQGLRQSGAAELLLSVSRASSIVNDFLFVNSSVHVCDKCEQSDDHRKG